MRFTQFTAVIFVAAAVVCLAHVTAVSAVVETATAGVGSRTYDYTGRTTSLRDSKRVEDAPTSTTKHGRTYKKQPREDEREAANPLANPDMSDADKEVAKRIGGTFDSFVSKQKGVKIAVVTLGVSVPIHIPGVLVDLQAKGMVTTTTHGAGAGKGVDFYGEVSIGLRFSLAVDLRVALIGSVSISCPDCTTLIETFQWFSYTVLRNYAKDAIDSVTATDPEVVEHNKRTTDAILNSWKIVQVEESSQKARAIFGLNLHQLRNQLEGSGAIVFPAIREGIDKGGVGLDERIQHSIAETDSVVKTYLGKYTDMLEKVYTEVIGTYATMGVAVYNHNSRRELRNLAKTQADGIQQEWDKLVKEMKNAATTAMTRKSFVDQLEKDWNSFVDRAIMDNKPTALPRGYEALRKSIGHDATRVLRELAFTRNVVMAAAQKRFQTRYIDVDCALGLTVSAGLEVNKKKWDFNIQVRGMIGRAGRSYPLRGTINPSSALKPYYGIVSYVDLTVPDLTASFLSILQFHKTKVVWWTRTIVQHAIVMGNLVPKSLKQWFNDKGKKIATFFKSLKPTSTKVSKGEGNMLIKSVMTKIKAFLKKEAQSPNDGFFGGRTRNPIKVGSGIVFQIFNNLVCNRDGSGCSFDTPIMRVGYQGGNILGALGNVLKKFDAIANAPFKFNLQYSTATCWEIVL